MIQPCMGGFCATRNGCQHYTDPDTRDEPSENLCKEIERVELIKWKTKETEDAV